MPEKFRNMYKPEDITLPPNFAEMPVVNCGWTKGRDEVLEAYPRQPEKVKQHICDYYAMISHVDECIGNVLSALEDKGMLENTIIVLCGDNGLAVGQHGLMGKQNIYEHSVRVPLLMCGPGVPAERTIDRFVYLFDIYPTLCELSGIGIPSSVEGRSFMRMFTDESFIIRKDMYLAFQARIRGVRDERYKLIEYRSENLKLTQLFDLQTDPWERNNFFDIAGYEEITARLRERLFEYRDEWGDETHKFGAQFWQAYRNYEKAAVRSVDKPKGANLSAQLASLKMN
jgi:arylsulfatase A-like enzyme